MSGFSFRANPFIISLALMQGGRAILQTLVCVA